MLMLSFLKTLLFLQFFALISTTHEGNNNDILKSSKNLVLSSRISGGNEVNIYSHPYTVSILRKNCVDCAYEHCCGGSILDEKTIITASQCVLDAESNHLQIVAGSSYRTNALQDGGMIFPVNEIYLHPNENIDLALLKLGVKIPIQNNFSMKAIKFANIIPKPGTLAVIVGWGQISIDGPYSEHLREAYIPIVNQTECQHNDDEIYNEKYNICAGFSNGDVDACEGDTGGPLLVDGYLIGITSRGYGCENPTKPGIYTNAIQLKDWISITASGAHTAFL